MRPPPCTHLHTGDASDLTTFATVIDAPYTSKCMTTRDDGLVVTHAVPSTSLELRSLVTEAGPPRLSLTDVAVPAPRFQPGPPAGGSGTDQSIRPGAAARRCGRGLGVDRGHDRSARGQRTTRRWGAAGTHGSSRSVVAGRQRGGWQGRGRRTFPLTAQALLGRIVAIAGGSMYAQYRISEASACTCFPKARRRGKGRRRSSTR